MALGKDECARIVALNDEMNRLRGDLRWYDDVKRLFPIDQQIRLAKTIVRLREVLKYLPASAWKAFFRLVSCDDSGLVDLAVDELKKLVELMKVMAEAELELISDKEQRQLYQQWLNQLDQAIQNWQPTYTRAVAVAVVKGLKQYLKDHAPAILRALLEYFGDDIARLAGQFVVNSLPSQLMTIVEEITVKLVARRLGIDAASKSLGLAVALTMLAVELYLYLYVIVNIQDIQQTLDEMQYRLVGLLVQCGAGWPFDPAVPALAFTQARYDGATVTLQPFVTCVRPLKGMPVWSAPCALKFADGSLQQRAVLGPAQLVKPNDWRVSVRIDEASLAASPCLVGAVLCYHFIKVDVTFANPRDGRLSVRVIRGAKSFPARP